MMGKRRTPKRRRLTLSACSQAPTLWRHPETGHIVQCSRFTHAGFVMLLLRDVGDEAPRGTRRSGYEEVLIADPSGPAR
jgi:hypothetical protein